MPDTNPKFSPWGEVDHCRLLSPGVFSVQTPGHGGIMVNQTVAEERLSLAARKRAIKDFGFFSYEEDCDCAIPLWEMEAERKALFNAATDEEQEQAKNSIYNNLVEWNLDYLKEIGSDPK